MDALFELAMDEKKNLKEELALVTRQRDEQIRDKHRILNEYQGVVDALKTQIYDLEQLVHRAYMGLDRDDSPTIYLDIEDYLHTKGIIK